MPSTIDPALTEQDRIVIDNLFEDATALPNTNLSANGLAPSVTTASSEKSTAVNADDHAAIQKLKAMNDPNSPEWQPTVFTSFDDKDIPEILNRYVVRPYARVAARIVRHPTDIVFLTHLLIYLSVNLPSAIILFRHFTWIHAIAHAAFTGWCVGPFTLLMHNHIHNNGVLAKEWHWLDATVPYILEPLMGHTWDSYYYHHVKHHHVEGNGPEDLSSTVRYQRDDVFHFLHYFGRFFLLIWLDLPLYFLRKNKPNLAVKLLVSEFSSYAFMYFMTTKVNFRASVFVLLIPFTALRLALMIGNWGQHALVDELEPDSDFRSSITLIDVMSNRLCFNDGYHTAHHLNPRRHWREQPVHFLQSKEAYSKGRALTFHNIDYFAMTFKLLQKDYMFLASCLVPMGDQVGMSQQEIADMLRTKTRKFTEDEIRAKFPQSSAAKARQQSQTASSYWTRLANLARNAGGHMSLRSPMVEADMSSRKTQ